MNRDVDNIKESLSVFAAKYGPAAVRPAQVVSINDDDTINVEIEGLMIEDVRLRSIIKSGSKIIMVPDIGSIVQIARIENSDEYIVIAVEEISRLFLMIGTVKLDIDEAGFLVKRGGEDLLSLISDLIDAQLNAVYNTANGPTTGLMPSSVTALNGIKTRFNSLLKSH